MVLINNKVVIFSPDYVFCLLGFRQARQDDQERGRRQRGADGRRVEEEIREGEGEELEAQIEDGKAGGGVEKVSGSN